MDRRGRVVELTILMPCLNEAETVGTCVRNAHAFLDASGIAGEVLVADNGSTDGSQAIAAASGARVVSVPQPGYGSALLGGIEAARGDLVVMGDADDSYDFEDLRSFVEALRDGADLVMGNRFEGGIAPGAMAWSHRYIGNPILSWLGRLFFHVSIGDFHCGLRGFRRERIRALRLSTTGMEFASEMVVRSALAGYRLCEVPTRLSRNGRSRPPHLRTLRDGWRHLRFLLLYSPRWLFLYPGVVLIVVGLSGVAALFPGEFRVGGIGLDIHTFVAACMAVLIGVQSVAFGAIARRYATLRGLLPAPGRYSGLVGAATPERILVGATILFTGSGVGVVWCILQWAAVDFGALADPRILRVLILSFTGLAAAVQLGLTAFLAGLMEIPIRQSGSPHEATGSVDW